MVRKYRVVLVPDELVAVLHGPRCTVELGAIEYGPFDQVGTLEDGRYSIDHEALAKAADATLAPSKQAWPSA